MSVLNSLVSSGSIEFEYETTVEPTTGKRQRRFRHSVPGIYAFLIAAIMSPSLYGMATALASPGPDSPSVTRPDDRGDENGQGVGQGTSQGGPQGQGEGRGNGDEPSPTSTSTSTSTPTASSTTTNTDTTTTTSSLPPWPTTSTTFTGPTTTETTILPFIEFYWPNVPFPEPPPGSYCSCSAP